MLCCQYYDLVEGHESAFAVDASSIVYGPGVLGEIGEHARALGMRRVAVFTDARVGKLECAAVVLASLRTAGIDVVLYDEVRVEPTDQSFIAAARFASDGRFDGYVSIGGGSVIDTCKAANLHSKYPADIMEYLNAPIGRGTPVPGPIVPHIACPTTSGTGSECTGVAVCDVVSLGLKTAIASRRIKPSLALIDPTTTYSLPKNVVASSGFDVLSHALESYTARPYTLRSRPNGIDRPMNQGANPWSDTGAEAALKRLGRYFERAVNDASDREARDQMMFAATLAGIAFGNSGVHLPHGMSYSVAGLVRDFRPDDYPSDEPMVPHGMSVILNAPSVFRITAPACPERHLTAADWLGADVRGASDDDAGEVLAGHLIGFMRATSMPNGVSEVGYREADITALAERAFAQKRLVNNAPCEITQERLGELFRGAMRYW